MRKFLSILSIVLILSFSLIGALSGIPHAHGHDLDHSHHASCPLHQFNLANPSGNFSIFEIAVFLLLILFLLACLRNNPLSSDYFSIKFFSSRAPPAVI
jgi:hypothetical protein